MKIKVNVSTDSRLVKQCVVIEDEDNPRNYLVVTTHSPTGSLKAIIKQLQEYLDEHDN
jgi:hypothetical protein